MFLRCSYFLRNMSLNVLINMVFIKRACNANYLLSLRSINGPKDKQRYHRPDLKQQTLNKIMNSSIDGF